jgi:hypothetical protein
MVIVVNPIILKRAGAVPMRADDVAALLSEVEGLREDLEDLRASANAWRALYENAIRRCAKCEEQLRKLHDRVERRSAEQPDRRKKSRTDRRR